MSNSKKSKMNFAFAILLMSSAFSSQLIAGDDIKNYPFEGYYNNKYVVQPNKHGNIVEEFDWQKEWGSIHMNTFADGLRDPGEPGAGPDSIIPCSQGDICKPTGKVAEIAGDKGDGMPISSIDPDVVSNGIKYDFKNSFLNCASRPSPNFPSGNGGWENIFSNFVCQGSNNSNLNQPLYNDSDYVSGAAKYDPFNGTFPESPWMKWGKATIIYSPLYDPRSNDERANSQTGNGAGCIQQISNSCANDIHECIDSGATDPKPEYHYPTSHVFRPFEVKMLKETGMVGNRMPEKYYAYTKNDGTPGLSATKDNYPDQKSGTDVTEIDTYNDKLAKIKTYRIENLGSIEADVVGFIIADPSNFFNLRHYMSGGSMAAGFGAHGIIGRNQKEANASQFETIINDKRYKNGTTYKNPKTYDTCPIIGIGGYGGICDPKPFDHPNWSGCNLPIYGISDGESEITLNEGTPDEITIKDRHNPVIWSGYVKKWAWLSVSQYLENIAGRRGANGGILYAGQTDTGVDIDHPDLNDSPIFMAERSPDYCDERERYKDRYRPEEDPDLPCIHYFQYQKLELPDGAVKWSFVNLFQPQFDGDFSTKYGYAYLDLFHQVTYKTKKEDGTIEEKTEPYIYDKFNIAGKGEKQLMPITCNEGLDAAEHGNCYDKGVGADDRDYLDDELLSGMGLDFGFDETMNYVTFMDAKAAKYTHYVIDEFGGIDTDKTVKKSAISFSEYCERGQAGCDNPAPLNMYGKDSIGEHIVDGDEESGTYLRLPAGKVLAVRLPDPCKQPENIDKPECAYVKEDDSKKISTRCAIAINKNMDPKANPYFVPTNSQAELDAFVNGSVSDIEFRKCKAEYLTYEKSNQAEDDAPDADGKGPNGTYSWFGQVKCSQLADDDKPTCNNTKIITAERFCILEDGKLGDCEECMAAMNHAVDDGNVIPSLAGDGRDDLLELPVEMNEDIGGIVLSSMSQCYFSAVCTVQSTNGCPAAATSGGHVFCLSADTKIDMADGSQKQIADIKDGEKVMAFTSKGSKSDLIKAKVVATTVTRDQDYLKVSIRTKTGTYKTLNITPEHKMVLSNGRAIMAKDLKKGVSVLDAKGELVLITSIVKAEDRIDVHNLILEDGADGYIAEGIRVQSYPLQSELKQMMSLSK